MSSPPSPYSRQYDFTGYQASNPTAPLPGNKVDQELNAVLTTLNATISRLGEVQRDDGKVRDSALNLDTIGEAVSTHVSGTVQLAINNAKDAQIAAVNDAGATQVAAVNAAGASFASTATSVSVNAASAAASATTAEGWKVNAQASALSATNSANNAFTHAGTAFLHASNAAAYRDEAGQHAAAAFQSFIDASGAAGTAANYSSSAYAYAEQANTYRAGALAAQSAAEAAAATAVATVANAGDIVLGDVQDLVDEAAASAAAAGVSATAAAGSATAAAASAASIGGSVTTATTAATNASNSASSAATSASNASTSASSASGSASAASTSASNASTSAANAATSASSALSSKNAAATSEANALSYKNSAQSASVAASNYASTASGYATDAANSYSAASTSEGNAASSASAAATSESNAASSASAAAASAASITPFDGGTVSNPITTPGLTLTYGGGGVLTFADGTTLSTAPTGGGGGGGGGSGTLTMSGSNLYDTSTSSTVSSLSLGSGSFDANSIVGGNATLNGFGLALAYGSGANISFADGTTQSTAGVDYAYLGSNYYTASYINGNYASVGQLNTKANIASPTFTGVVVTAASATSGSGFRLPHGAAPTTPTNGDLWTTTTGLFVRINGANVGYAAVTGSNTYATGSKQTFGAASSTTAPVNIPGVSTQPSSISAGDVYHTTGTISQIVGYANSMRGAMTACRAFVNFNGSGTVATRNNYNVSSITDNGVGDYTINFTNAMVDADYSCFFSVNSASATNASGYAAAVKAAGIVNAPDVKTASAVRIIVASTSSTADLALVQAVIFR